MSTFTTAKQLELVANSSYVGTWDQPTNSNWSVVDAALGGFISIPLNNSPVTLSTPQFQSAMITFTSTLTGNVPITFPTSFTGFYTILNTCTGSSAFVVTLLTTAAGGQVIGCKPGDAFEVYNDGTNLKYRNLGMVGTYWDYAGSSVPLWVDSCTVPPFLNCNAGTFSSATYPQLARILGTTTLPDSRGRGRISLNQGQSRVTTAIAGFDGDTRFTGGGSQLSQAHTHPVSISDPTHTHSATTTGSPGVAQGAPGGGNLLTSGSGTVSVAAAATGITAVTLVSTYAKTIGGNSANVQPSYVGGITMIRAA